ncbi:MAG TPA: hypothetical protein VMG08_05540 [Allosphingosinicella sp.]|nr:hypothetical protein [Allosphingosinicella sp.]
MINRTGFALLALGALLFSALLYVAMTYHILGWPSDTETEAGLGPQELIALYTIVFGLPYALYTLARGGNVLKVVFLVLLIPAIHYGAIYLFLWWTAEGQAMAPAINDMGEEIAGPAVSPAVIGGVLAGLAGALVSFALVALLGLRAATAGFVVFLAGLLLLALWGGVGFWLLGDTPERPIDLILKLFLPWQLIFAFFLSALLSPTLRRR